MANMKLNSLRTTLALVLGGALIAAPSMAKELNIYNWSYYIDEGTVPAFEKANTTKVRYDTYDSTQMVETKLLTGRSGYDVVFYDGSSNRVPGLIKAGAFQKLDKSKLPNFKYFNEDMKKWQAANDPNFEYFAPYLWGSVGIGYNADLVKKHAGEAPTDSWSLLLDPQIVSKLSGCGVSLTDDPQEVYLATLSYLGMDPKDTSSKALSAVSKHLKKIRPYITNFGSQQVVDTLANGDACVTMSYSGDAFIAMDNAAEAKNGVNVAFSIPKEGTLVFFDAMFIPADAKNVESAHSFINTILEPKTIAKQTNYVFYANPNTESAPFVDAEILNDPAIYPPEEVQSKLYTRPIYDSKFTRKLMRMWNKFKAG